MHANLRENAAQGARKWDEVMPGWYRKIDTATLDITSTTRCICGQLMGSSDKTGSYFAGLTMLGIAPGQSGAYGFSACGGGSKEILKEAWKEEIEARLLADEFAMSEPETLGV